MRKLQQVVIAAVAAGGLSAIGAGAAVADTYGGDQPLTSDQYRPYQECSPQTVSENNVPVPVLGLADTLGVNCHQYNNAFTTG
ncbi:hypothetical protein A6P39_027490 [Streptomyces sp. FXJ1.172]|uniref:hypothetical protein n=1 Tax=Streptomyces sp. FXJ1.172 TaxID=710705 RepID=UPI0007CF1FE2|nr:hypothetical protein [Streptomyces sp. FXJ1.172]WEO97460.1 hypothetical protein A6P39_027490 [Streptomyces sp. FXJ1.172]